MIDLDIITIEEALAYLLPKRGEVVFMSSPVENSAVGSQALVKGRVVATMPEGHPLARNEVVSVHDLMQFPFFGVAPDDRHGETLARPFHDAGLIPRHTVRGRFAQTMVAQPVGSSGGRLTSCYANG
jgi:hypothetical protein